MFLPLASRIWINSNPENYVDRVTDTYDVRLVSMWEKLSSRKKIYWKDSQYFGFWYETDFFGYFISWLWCHISWTETRH